MQAAKWIKLDHAFLKEVLAEPGGEHAVECSNCGTCTGTCPVSQHYPTYNPRLLFHKVSLGMRDQVLSSPEIWLCSECDNCYSRCPHQIHISEVMKALRNIAIREGYERPGATAHVKTARCTGCSMCVEVCPYDAIGMISLRGDSPGRHVASVNASLCNACGMCNGVCPSNSIAVDDYADVLLHAGVLDAVQQLSVQRNGGHDATILAIICNWCLRAQPDIEYASNPPPGVQVLHVPCSGRVSPTLITAALERGLEGILVVGCQEDECHYRHGNQLEQTRLRIMGTLLDLLGINQGRVQFAQLGSLDRGKLPLMIDAMLQEVRAIAQERTKSVQSFEAMGTLQALL